MLIDDGKGKGYKAEVDDENKLHVQAIADVGQFHTNHDHGTAYTMDIDNVVVNGDGYNFLYIQNTDDDDLIVTSITLWVATAKDDANVEAYIGHTLTSVANNTSIVPSNLNAGSGQSASGVFYVNDGVGNLTTLSGGVVAGRWKPTTSVGKWSKTTGWIVPKNQTFTLLATKDNTFRGYISFYVHNSQV